MILTVADTGQIVMNGEIAGIAMGIHGTTVRMIRLLLRQVIGLIVMSGEVVGIAMVLVGMT